jgi:MarR family transcriptional regulator, 2-MHQ and catechol-resistance regulon repressor
MSTTSNGQATANPTIAAYVKLIRTSEALHLLVGKGLAAEGLTPSQFSTMKVLRMRGPLAQRDIAKYLLKTGGNVTVVVDNLEKQGLVLRIRDTEDRRIVFVKLTEEGADLFDRIYAPHLDRIEEAMSGLSRQDCAALCELLEKLAPAAEAPFCQPLEGREDAALSRAGR